MLASWPSLSRTMCVRGRCDADVKTDVFTSASHLPRTHIVLDNDGHEASIFHGFTSGQTFLYDGDGRLRFSGGITLLRGHAGFNSGSAEVMQIARTRAG